jgi:t-SNARE complex subunit (syntaxin)
VEKDAGDWVVIHCLPKGCFIIIIIVIVIIIGVKVYSSFPAACR